MASSEASRATRYQAPRRSAQLTSTWRRPHCIPGTAENTSGGLPASVIQATPISATCFRDPRGAPSSCPPSSPRCRSGWWPPGPSGTANPAYRPRATPPRDRGTAFPESLRVAGREIERLTPRGRATERVLDVDGPGVGAVQRPGAAARDVAQHEPHVYAAIGHVRPVGEHRAGDEPLTACERESEQQARDRDRRGLPAHREQVQTDREEELPVLRIAEVEMM